MSKSGQIRVGVGGWTFEPWRGVFYPDSVKQKDELAYMSRQLRCIEINGTYYSSFKPDSWKKWRDETPDGFVFTVKGSRFTYATGKLVLWSANANLVDGKGDVLKKGDFKKLAIANPKVAPYGAAAVETMTKLGLLDAITPKLVQGESIGQTFSFISTGNAELGFVALSQVLEGGKLKAGSAWTVPATLHAPIVQDAVVLERGKDNKAAAELIALLKSDRIKDLIRSYGYDL